MKIVYKCIKKIYYYIIEKIYYCYIYIKYKVSHVSGINENQNRKNKIIVSITSIPSRFDKLYLCLETIMEQTMKPDKIILYLGVNTKDKALPQTIVKLKKRGLTIEYREDKYLKPHTKYFYAMQEYPNDIIITFDDDILYNKNIIENLYNSYLRFPNAVSAIRVHKITFTDKNEIDKYDNWKFEYTGEDSLTPNHYLCATGVGGVLYPPHIMIDETFNLENIKNLSLNTDDLWLKIMEIKGNIKVVKAIKENYHLYIIKETQSIALNKSNVGAYKNIF
jgi:hypothetical protein